MPIISKFKWTLNLYLIDRVQVPSSLKHSRIYKICRWCPSQFITRACSSNISWAKVRTIRWDKPRTPHFQWIWLITNNPSIIQDLWTSSNLISRYLLIKGIKSLSSVWLQSLWMIKELPWAWCRCSSSQCRFMYPFISLWWTLLLPHLYSCNSGCKI